MGSDELWGQRITYGVELGYGVGLWGWVMGLGYGVGERLWGQVMGLWGRVTGSEGAYGVGLWGQAEVMGSGPCLWGQG